MANFIDRIFDRNLSGLERTLDLNLKRNEAIVSNISNAETPQYRAVDVNFAGELERAFEVQSSPLKLTDPKHLDLEQNSGTSHLVADLSGETRADGNNVDIDLQMGRLAYTSGQYTNAANMVRRKFQLLRDALRFAQR